MMSARTGERARGGQLLATSVVAEVARSREFMIVEIGPSLLHNITDPVGLYEIIIDGGGRAETIDPICRMRVPDHLAAARIEIDGHGYRFCSADCAATFVANRQTRSPGR
jgi:YHS domain-containing protein